MEEKFLQNLRNLIASNHCTEVYKSLREEFYSPLHRFACSFVKSAEQAEEIVADVLYKVWEKRFELCHIHNLKVYLFTAVKNHCLNYLLKKEKEKLVALNDLDVELMKFESNPEQILISAEMVKRIQQAVDALPPRCKIIFKLIREEGFRNKEVADILGISVNTIDVQLAIAIKKISQAINLDISGNRTVANKFKSGSKRP